MASRKLSHVGIALVILTFLITSISVFIGEADRVTSQDSGIVIDSFNSYNNDLADVNRRLSVEVSERIDNNTDLTIEEGQLLEDRSTDTAGIINLFSKNVLISFFKNIGDKLQITGEIIAFFITLVSLTIIFLLVRFIWGDNKI